LVAAIKVPEFEVLFVNIVKVLPHVLYAALNTKLTIAGYWSVSLNHMNTTVSKLPEDGGCGYYRLLVEWNSSSFKVVLLRNGYAWTGHVRLFIVSLILRRSLR
jgi:hypothetical protein